MRLRLLTLVGAILFIETSLFTAITPLLPHLAERYNLSKAETGVLVGCYAAGAFVAAIPAGLLAARFGVKLTTLSGLALVGAASVAFGFASSTPTLFVARFIQGVGGALAWTGTLAWLVGEASRERRGQLIGLALGAALAGTLFGPIVGIAASLAGTGSVFSGVAGIALLLLGLGSTARKPPQGTPQSLQTLLSAVRTRQIAGGLWLIVLAGLLVGVLGVLGPLRLKSVGWGAAGIGVVFLLIAAGEVVLNPILGRWSDLWGRLTPVRLGLVLATAFSAVLALSVQKWPYAGLVVAAGISYGFFWTPAMALLSDASEARGISYAYGFALMNLGWAPGHLIGASVGGALAQSIGDAVPYLLVSGLCLATLFAMQLDRHLIALWPARSSKLVTPRASSGRPGPPH